MILKKLYFFLFVKFSVNHFSILISGGGRMVLGSETNEIEFQFYQIRDHVI